MIIAQPMVKIVARHMIYLMSKTLSLLRILSLGQMLSVLVLITGMQLLVRQILLRLAAKKTTQQFSLQGLHAIWPFSGK